MIHWYNTGSIISFGAYAPVITNPDQVRLQLEGMWSQNHHSFYNGKVIVDYMAEFVCCLSIMALTLRNTSARKSSTCKLSLQCAFVFQLWKEWRFWHKTILHKRALTLKNVILVHSLVTLLMKDLTHIWSANKALKYVYIWTLSNPKSPTVGKISTLVKCSCEMQLISTHVVPVDYY